GEHFSDLILAQHLVDEVLEIGSERVAYRHHTDHAAVLDDRQLSEATVVHHLERERKAVVGIDRPRIGRHHLPERGHVGLDAFGEYTEESLALGEHAEELLALDDPERADGVLLHQTRRFGHGHTGRRGHRFLAFDDL